MSPPSNHEEDIIVPEFRPLLGDGDTGSPIANITEEDAFRLLREALESDSANRSEIVEQAGLYSFGRRETYRVEISGGAYPRRSVYAEFQGSSEKWIAGTSCLIWCIHEFSFGSD